MKSKSKTKKTFSKKDFNSNDGMLTTVWGPTMWHFLHTMSFNYPVKPTEEQKKHYKEFLLQLQHILPCGKCRENLKENFKKLPPSNIHFKDRAHLSKYVYQLHELVNTMLQKKTNLTYAQVRERYEHFRSRCTKNDKADKKKKTLKEKGCTNPIYGEKSKCILKIVPQETKCETLTIDDKCIKKRLFDVCSANTKN